MTRYFLPNGLLVRGFVLLLSITAVSCSDYSQKTVDVNAAPSSSIYNRTVDDALLNFVIANISYPDVTGEDTEILVEYTNNTSILDEIEESVRNELGPILTIEDSEEVIEAEISTRKPHIPVGGKIKVKFFDIDEEDLNISEMKVSLYLDRRLVIEDKRFNVNDGEVKRFGIDENNDAVFKTEMTLDINEDVSSVKNIRVRIDSGRRTYIEFEMISTNNTDVTDS